MYHYNKEILRKGVPKLYTRWGKENIIEVIYSNVGAAADIFFKGGDAPKKTLLVFFSCEIKQKQIKYKKQLFESPNWDKNFKTNSGIFFTYSESINNAIYTFRNRNGEAHFPVATLPTDSYTLAYQSHP